MRIVFVVGSAQMGGTERNVLRLAGALLAGGLTVEVLLVSDDGPLLKQYQACRIPVTTVSWSYRVRWFPAWGRPWPGLVPAVAFISRDEA